MGSGISKVEQYLALKRFYRNVRPKFLRELQKAAKEKYPDLAVKERVKRKTKQELLAEAKKHNRRLKRLASASEKEIKKPAIKNIVANRRVWKQFRATPAWADKAMINKVYEKSKCFGMAVDHIVPIMSKIVCGLHVWDNLQLLEKGENSAKSNRHWPDMP